MDSKEVTEMNKLIAQFDPNFKIDNSDPKGDSFSTIDGTQWVHKSSLKYHSSWDWLMPVVEKIESTGFQFYIHNEGVEIKRWFWRGNFPDIGVVEEKKIDAVWKAVVQFITWYNSQQNKPQQ